LDIRTGSDILIAAEGALSSLRKNIGTKRQRPDIHLVEERCMFPKELVPMKLLLETIDSLFNDNNSSNMLPGS
jgi:flavin-dependent dehydrogenase